MNRVRRRDSPRARRLALRLDPAAGVVELVVPSDASETEVARFLDRHKRWIARRLGELPPRVPFADGAELAVLGEPLRICHRRQAPPGPRRHGGELVIGGEPGRLPARARAWLRETARAALHVRAHGHARHIGHGIAAIRIGDPRSRWGSCSSRGTLAFSWRLVLAPESVLDYVAAHEVAHLAVMSHSRRFWSLLGEIYPDFKTARAWLATHGPSLHRYG